MLSIQKQCEKQDKFDAELVMPFELRQKSRLRTQTTTGEEVGLFLPRGVVGLLDGFGRKPPPVPPASPGAAKTVHA